MPDRRDANPKIDIATKAIVERIQNGPHPFTFRDLHSTGDAAVGEYGFSYRIADRLIQRERQAGRIKQKARGIWVPA